MKGNEKLPNIVCVFDYGVYVSFNAVEIPLGPGVGS